MISLTVLFYIIVGLFFFIGAMRGWTKEVLVTFSGILAIFISTVILPLVYGNMQPLILFWVRFGILIACILFGYQTPNLRRIEESGRFLRNQARDIVMGAIFGAFNGYLIFGSAWYYLAAAGYPFPEIAAPEVATTAGEAAVRILNLAMPNLLQVPAIYFAIAIAFVIVMVIFI